MNNFERLIEKKIYSIEVSVRDARKANDALKDDRHLKFDTDGSNVFIFKSENDLENALDMLQQADIEPDEVLSESVGSAGSINKKKKKGFSPDAEKQLKKIKNLKIPQFMKYLLDYDINTVDWDSLSNEKKGDWVKEYFKDRNIIDKSEVDFDEL